MFFNMIHSLNTSAHLQVTGLFEIIIMMMMINA